MPMYSVTGSDAETGMEGTLRVRAAGPEEAVREASRRGLVAEAVTAAMPSEEAQVKGAGGEKASEQTTAGVGQPPASDDPEEGKALLIAINLAHLREAVCRSPLLRAPIAVAMIGGLTAWLAGRVSDAMRETGGDGYMVLGVVVIMLGLSIYARRRGASG